MRCGVLGAISRSNGGSWHAINHWTDTVVADVFGRRTDEVFLQSKVLLEPFGIRRFHTDYWGVYAQHLGAVARLSLVI
jgi:IS1 family transposase